MKLYYRRFGNGKPVVVLHGLFGLSDNWTAFGRRLGEHYSVYIPDMRNHGQSPHSNFFNFPVLEDDLLEMIEEWGTNEIYLIGHSLGGKTAMFFTIHHPETVKKLVVVDISLRRALVNTEHQMLLDAMLSVDLSSAYSRSDVENQLSTKISSEKLRRFLLKNIYWRHRKTLDWRLNLRAINDNLPSIFEGVADPGSYGGPTLFIRGGSSDYILDSDFPELEMKFPGASVVTIANASHWVHADAPEEFYMMVSNFLDR